jgi:hypothetical protein
MSDAWERARALAEKHAQAGGIFVKLANNGDKVVGAFCGEPNTREVVWVGDHYEVFDADKHKDKKPSLRVSINFYVPAEGKMKVIEGGTQWFKDVLKVREKYGLDTWLFEIERHGEAGDTKTKYTILPETKIDTDLRARMAPVELHDLASIGVGGDDEDDDPRAKGAPAKPAAAKPGATDVAAVISEGAALELIGRLKSLPRPEAEMLVKRFGITRVREMKASDEAAARRFLEDLERKNGLAAPTEVDPFV